MSKITGLGHYHELDLSKSANDEKIKTVYKDWAAQYDSDNDAVLGTVSQPNCVALLATAIQDKTAKILDVGCGTGLVGKYLYESGFSNFDGLDISAPMLENAKGRGYKQLVIGSLSQRLPMADNSYDATLCVGVFTHGHVTSDGLLELIRITKKGGFICFTVNEGVYDDYRFGPMIKALSDEKTWHIHKLIKDAYMTIKQVQGYYCLAEVL